MKKYNVVIIGAGAAGLAAAGMARMRGRNVAILDIGPTPARKVRVSGGGRCNFTNAAASRDRYFGTNPDFVRSALSQITPNDILNWAKTHNISPIQKTPGQYFSGTGAAAVVDTLVQDAAGADIFLDTPATDILHDKNGFIIKTDHGDFFAESVIIATGGVSYPNLGVSDFGMKIAKKFGHKIIPIRPALCAIKTDVFAGAPAGISLPTEIKIGRNKIRDSLLFTHNGIGGPCVYRATVRNLTDDIHINLCPDYDVLKILQNTKHTEGRKTTATILSQFLPQNLARYFAPDVRHIADIRDSELFAIATRITNTIIPRDKIQLVGMNAAEVMRGGVSTDDINQRTMESKLMPGLFFAGEVMDITGDLGGFNLHWAFATGRIAGQNA